MGEIVCIITLTLVILYFGLVNHRDREHYIKTISDMNNKLMAKSLQEYSANKSRIDQAPDEPVTTEERLAKIQLRHESEDIFPVS